MSEKNYEVQLVPLGRIPVLPTDKGVYLTFDGYHYYQLIQQGDQPTGDDAERSKRILRDLEGICRKYTNVSISFSMKCADRTESGEDEQPAIGVNEKA